jgi:integrase
MRLSAKTRSWEQAESLARKYEIAAVGGEDVKEARSLPTLKEAVNGYLADAVARGLAPASIQKVEHIFKKQLLGFAEKNRIIFLRDVNVRNMTEWRSSWTDKPLARKKKFERVVGFFWFCVRHGWLKENPTATMGRIIAKHVPTDYFTADEYKRIVSATYRLGDDAERSWSPEKRGVRIRALTELMRWSGLRIRDAVTLECSRLDGNKLLLYQAKTGIPVFVPLPPHVVELLNSIPPGLKPNPNYFFWSGNGVFCITCGQIRMRRKVCKWIRSALQVGEEVEFAVKMTICGKDILHVETLAIRIALGLLHSLQWVFTLSFCFEHPNWQRFWHIADTHTEQIVGTSGTISTAPLGAGWFYRGGRLQFELLVIGISLCAQHGIDKKIAGFLFVVGHGFFRYPL